MKHSTGQLLTGLIIFYLIIALVTVVAVSESNAQAVRRQTIGSSGTHGYAGRTYLSHTVGQPYGAMTSVSGSVVFRPGFQQSALLRMDYIPVAIRPSLSVYPNPATASVTIKFPETVYGATLEVRDKNGYPVVHETLNGRDKYSFNCEAWTPGFYFITVHDHQNHERTSSKLIITK